MKYLKKKQNKRGPVIIGLVIVLLAVTAVIMMLFFRGNDKTPQAESLTATEGITEPTETAEAATTPIDVVIEKPVARDYDVVELVDGQIQTPYVTLNYPEGLAEFLLVINTSQDPYTLEFYATMEGKEELRLFDISLGEGSGGNMGTVMTPEGEVPLNVMIYILSFDESWTEGEILTAYAMQDVVNEMIDQMVPQMEEIEGAEDAEEVEDIENVEEEAPEAPVISQQPEEGGTVHNLEIETPYATLYYPARWSGYLSSANDATQEEVYKVHFYGKIEGYEDIHLFSLYFGGDEGEQLGAVMSEEEIPVPVNLVMEELNLDDMSDEDAQILYSMQEASNQLIARLPLLQ